jgi:hypothetical protein
MCNTNELPPRLLEKYSADEINDVLKTRASDVATRSKAKGFKKWDYGIPQIRALLLQSGGICPYTGDEFTLKGDYVFSVDRINHKKGYVLGNVILVAWWANRGKGKMSLTKYLSHINYTYLEAA